MHRSSPLHTPLVGRNRRSLLKRYFYPTKLTGNPARLRQQSWLISYRTVSAETFQVMFESGVGKLRPSGRQSILSVPPTLVKTSIYLI